jgi:hypothetical protein
MSSGERMAEERDGFGTLVEHSNDPNAGRIPVDDEELVEVRHLENGSRREGALKRLERVLHLLVPCEGVAVQEAGEWCRDEAEVADELPVVPSEPQEAAKATAERGCGQAETATTLFASMVLTVYFGTPNMFITVWFGFVYGTNPTLGTLII